MERSTGQPSHDMGQKQDQGTSANDSTQQKQEGTSAANSVSNNDRDSNGATQTLSFGQQTVGLNFNPSGDDKVNRAKTLCAELADLLRDDIIGKDSNHPLIAILENPTYKAILDAQMSVVKLLTLKY